MGYISQEICIDFLDNVKSIVDNSPYPNAEIHLTEWNSSPSPRDLIHNIPFMAPFILYNITQNFGKVNSLASGHLQIYLKKTGRVKVRSTAVSV